MKMITIMAGSITLSAELNDKPTAQRIWDALPIEGHTNRWGDEIYFEIPITAEVEPDARQDVEVGALGYWQPGSAFCIFFGPTPVSSGTRPRAYSPVNLLGHVREDATQLRAVRSGEKVTLTRA